jgi:hypothetical protein
MARNTRRKPSLLQLGRSCASPGKSRVRCSPTPSTALVACFPGQATAKIRSISVARRSAGPSSPLFLATSSKKGRLPLSDDIPHTQLVVRPSLFSVPHATGKGQNPTTVRRYSLEHIHICREGGLKTPQWIFHADQSRLSGPVQNPKPTPGDFP